MPAPGDPRSQHGHPPVTTHHDQPDELSDLAELITSNDGDNQAITVTVRNEDGGQVYAGTLTFAGSRRDG